MIEMWEFQRTLSRRLAQWAGLSTLLGLPMMLRRRYWRGVGGQFVGWAFVNLAIAFFGTLMADQRRRDLPDPTALEIQEKERANLRRLLWINAGLDVGYMAGGLWLGRSRRAGRRGMGLGVFLQGMFLFWFDIYHALLLQETPSQNVAPPDNTYV